MTLNSRAVIKRSRLSLLFAFLTITGCHSGTHQASPETELPTVEVQIAKPRTDSNGAVWILREQYVQHIGTPGVFILAESGKARFRMVKAGKMEANRIAVISGLKGDEVVLTGPLESVLDGSPVSVTNQ